MLLCLFSMGVLGLRPDHLNRLFEFDGDSLQALRWMKATFEPGGYYENQRLGAPLAASHYGFPRMMALDLPALWAWHQLGWNPALFYNLFYLSGFFLAAASAYWVLLRWGCAWPVALQLAWLYAFLPGHIDRYGHPTMILYFCAPLAFFDGLALLRGQPLTTGSAARGLLAGLCGPYIAFFYCLVLAWAGAVGSLRQLCWRPLLRGMLACFGVSLLLLLSLAPNMAGKGKEPAPLPYRAPSDLVTWSSTIGQLVLPQNARSGHPLRAIAREYFGRFPQPSATEASYLGMASCLGLLGLLVSWLAQRPGVPSHTEPDRHELATLALGVWLIQCCGGLNPLLALVIGTSIRSYNRFSFWLAFLGLAALGLELSRRKQSRPQHWALLALSVFAWSEQARASRGWYPERCRAEWNQVQAFVAELETRYPAGSMIWQLPLVGYPERPPLHREGWYGLLRPYLVSERLHFSTGSVEGSRVDRLQRALTLLPLSTQLDLLRRSGFTALMIHRAGYADRATILEQELQHLGAVPDGHSSDGELACYRLAGTATPNPQAFEPAVVEASWQRQPFLFTSEAPNGALFRGAGWGDFEPNGCWSLGRKSRLELVAPRPGTYRAELELQPMFNRQGRQQLRLRSASGQLADFSFRQRQGDEVERLQLELQLPGWLEFEVAEPQRPSWLGSSDTRPLGVQLRSLRLTLSSL